MTDRVKKQAPWFVYILSCSDGTLYTGITTDPDRRVGEHNAGKAGARYTRSRRPVRLVYREAAESRSEAARREYRIRRMTAAQKRALVAASPATKTLLAQRRREKQKHKKVVLSVSASPREKIQVPVLG